MFLICRKTMRVAQEPRFAAVFHVHFYQPECGMRNVSHTSVLKYLTLHLSVCWQS